MNNTRQFKPMPGQLDSQYNSAIATENRKNIDYFTIKEQFQLFNLNQKNGKWRISATEPHRFNDADSQKGNRSPQRQGRSANTPQQRIVFHIEDDEEDRMLLEEALIKLDPHIIVKHAESGDAALSLLKASKELCTLPCLIVLDINLPGLNGKEVLKEIKKDQELQSLPLILYTTASEAAYRDFLEKENVELITKPSSPSELISCAKKMLNRCPPQ